MISDHSKIIYIQSNESLRELSVTLQGQEWLAFDTEFMRERTYFPQLCLLQLATNDLVACIDPLACTDLTPLLDVLYSPAILKVLHAASQDLEILFHLRNSVPKPIFDTQIAATVLGERANIGYAEIIESSLGVTLAKAHTRTDWSQRPLSEAQLQYAADDVRYLAKLFQIQRDQLLKLKRWEWLERDLTLLTNEKRYELNLDDAWMRVKDAARLRGMKLAVLRRLAAWRELRAMNVNKPRRWIMSDEILIALAEQLASSSHQVSTLFGKEKGLLRFTKEIAEIVEHACLEPRESWPQSLHHSQLDREQQSIIKLLTAALEKRAKELNVIPSILATRKDLMALVQGQRDVSVLKGWREEVIGRELLKLLREPSSASPT